MLSSSLQLLIMVAIALVAALSVWNVRSGFEIARVLRRKNLKNEGNGLTPPSKLSSSTPDSIYASDHRLKVRVPSNWLVALWRHWDVRSGRAPLVSVEHLRSVESVFAPTLNMPSLAHEVVHENDINFMLRASPNGSVPLDASGAICYSLPVQKEDVEIDLRRELTSTDMIKNLDSGASVPSNENETVADPVGGAMVVALTLRMEEMPTPGLLSPEILAMLTNIHRDHPQTSIFIRVIDTEDARSTS